MGGSKPSAPTVIMPAQTQPQQFQSIIPQKSFKDLAKTMRSIERETGKIQRQRYDEVGTPAEIGAQSRGTDFLAAAAYLSSLPKSDPDTSFQTTPRPFDITSTRNAFDQTEGQFIGAGTGESSAPDTAPKSKLDFVKRAAKENLKTSKREYFKAVKRAKKVGRPKPTITKNPSFANQDPKLFLPRRYNPETGEMDIV